jgi:outer membrane protein OmpA-like peptidoglycan-associated protein
VVTPPVGPVRLDALKQARVERTDGRGRRIIEEPGNRTIIRQDNRVFVHRDESKHIQTLYPNARATRLPSGVTQTVYVRPDGVRVFSEVDGSGRLVRRYGRDPRGREINYLDNRRFYRNLALGVGIGAVGIGIALALAPPAHAVPRHQYIVDYDRASDDDLYVTLTAPPVVRLERSYSLEEVRYSHPLRERMRRVDLDTITFEFGTFVVSEDQYSKLERVARAIGRAIEKNPAEMFLIEGHTDAVGSSEDNLTLSDRRAEAVARVLSEHFSIPMENLVTQGYGEQHLKVESSEAERANRRVAVRRISPLLGQDG